MRETLDIFRFVENLDFCSVTHESEIGLLLFMRIYMKTICSGECIVQLYPYSSSRSEWVRASYSIKKTRTHIFFLHTTTHAQQPRPIQSRWIEKTHSKHMFQ